MKRAILLLLLVAGLVLRLTEAERPIDASTYTSWRECDLGMIARNFWRGDMNIAWPQIDWRGDGPGYVESEFPLHAWLMAVGYRLLGYHEAIGRWLALGIALLSLAVFGALARRLLPPLQAGAAVVLFWFNPILVRFGTNIQPDPGMLLAVLLCLLGVLHWEREPRRCWLVGAALAGALAVLLKASAVYVVVPIGMLAWRRWGWRAALKPSLWALATLMLAPPAAWYMHARAIWMAGGHSLGLSNNSHWIGADLFGQPGQLAHLLHIALRLEIKWVWAGLGVLPALIALRRLTREREIIIWWLAGAAVFYLAIIRTSSQNWAYYYHVLSVPPACLLMALGMPDEHACRRLRDGLRRSPRDVLHAALALGVLVLVIEQGARTVDWTPPREGEGAYRQVQFDAAHAFAPRIEPDALVVTCGDNTLRDETGAPIAHNESPMLFWLDRKGFTVTLDEQNAETIRALRARGALYLVFREDQPMANAAGALGAVAERHEDYTLLALH